MAEQVETDGGGGVYERAPASSLEFDRVAAFSDAVFAIALTLLVLTIRVPELTQSQAKTRLVEALWDQRYQVLSFLIAFALVGRYWVAHHRFFASLRAITPGYIGINLVFLGLICFLPYPTDVLGNYSALTPAVVLFSVCMIAVSSLETVLYAYAYHRHLIAEPPTPRAYRVSLIASQVPSLIFLVSIVVALASPAAAMYLWLANFLVRPTFGRAQERARAG